MQILNNLFEICVQITHYLVLYVKLSDVISDSEPKFLIFILSDMTDIAEWVIEFVSNCYDLLLSYSNSVCDLLIVKLLQQELIVILLYRPPSCSNPEFEDVILKMKSVMFKLVSPLPNIIMLGYFNLPTISCSQPGDCFTSRILVLLSNYYFFNHMSIQLLD